MKLDAEHVKLLTKPEMIEFYSTYIHPTSPARAKLAVYLIAQGGCQDANGIPDAEKADATAPSNGTEPPVMIRDVRTYKAGLVAGAGPRPAQEASAFEETDPKL